MQATVKLNKFEESSNSSNKDLRNKRTADKSVWRSRQRKNALRGNASLPRHSSQVPGANTGRQLRSRFLPINELAESSMPPEDNMFGHVKRTTM